jgi:hypothetical protein
LSYCPRSSLPAHLLAWPADRLAHLLPPRPPGTGGTPPLSLEVRLDALAAVLLDGLSYRRAARMVGIAKTQVGDSLDLLLARLATLATASPTAPSSPASTSCAAGFPRWPPPARRSAWTGWPPGCNAPAGRPTRRSCTTPSGTPTPPKARPSRPSTATCCGWTAAGRAAATSTSSSTWQAGGDAGGVEVASLLDRGFRGLAKTREHWHAPVGDRRTIDRLSHAQRTYNRLQAGPRALVEQSIGHLANAWALRRWRGLLYRARDVFRAAGALICLGRWLHRVPA